MAEARNKVEKNKGTKWGGGGRKSGDGTHGKGSVVMFVFRDKGLSTCRNLVPAGLLLVG